MKYLFYRNFFVDVCKLGINQELILQVLITKVNLLLRVKRPSKNIPYAPTPVDGGRGSRCCSFSGSAQWTFVRIYIIKTVGLDVITQYICMHCCTIQHQHLQQTEVVDRLWSCI